MQFGFVSATFEGQILGRFESQPGCRSSQIFELKQVQSVCKIVSVSGVLLRSRQISSDILGLPKESGTWMRTTEGQFLLRTYGLWFVQGLSSNTPVGAKCSVFRVMTCRPWRRAVAAMRPSLAGP